MNPHNTIEKMKHLRLLGMATIYHQSLSAHLYRDHTLDQFTALLIDQEWEDRQNRRIKSLIRQAGFKLSVSPHDIDYSSSRNLDKNQLERLLGLQFIKQAEKRTKLGPYLHKTYRSRQKSFSSGYRSYCLPDALPGRIP
jgi:DNA replication protein DnaC